MYWDQKADKKVFYDITLSPDSKEYKDVAGAFHKTSSNEIVSIKRIQNRGNYEQYNATRERMIRKYGSIDGREKMLFHGTAKENLDQINAGGLNRSYAGKHGKI